MNKASARRRGKISKAKLFREMLTGSMARGLFEKKGETRHCRDCSCENCPASGKGFYGNWGCWSPKGCLVIESDEKPC